MEMSALKKYMAKKNIPAPKKGPSTPAAIVGQHRKKC
jgi:hypothetical protein